MIARAPGWRTDSTRTPSVACSRPYDPGEATTLIATEGDCRLQPRHQRYGIPPPEGDLDDAHAVVRTLVSSFEQLLGRFYARIGVPQFRQSSDGSVTELEPTFHDLVIFRKNAERAYEAFRKGDTFVAWGYINEYPFDRHCQRIVREEFVARHIGHNLVLTKYVVERKQPTPLDPDLSLAPTREPVPEPVVGH